MHIVIYGVVPHLIVQVLRLNIFLNICLLNDKSPTYFHPASGSFTSIDLSLCSASVLLDFAWQVYSYQCGSDHFPIFIDMVKSMPKDNAPLWNLKKANWPKFKLQCQ